MLGIWLTVLSVGFLVLWRYEAAAGQETRAPSSWPAESHLSRAQDRNTLVMFVHPRCPCSRASLAELRRLLPRVRGHVTTSVVFVRPPGVGVDWERSALRGLATSLADVVVFDDHAAVEARRFGAATSGATLLYDAAGRLVFSGGLTAVRGHEGESAGQEQIISLVRTGRAEQRETPVFGCRLGDRGARSEGGT